MLQIISDGGFWMIPITLLGFIMLVLGLDHFYRIFLKKEYSHAKHAHRTQMLKRLGLGALLVGILGTLVGIYQGFSVDADSIKALGEMIFLMTTLRYAITTTIWGLTLFVISMIFVLLSDGQVRRLSQDSI